VNSKLNNALFGGGRNFVWRLLRQLPERLAFGVAVSGVLGDRGDPWRVIGEQEPVT
jgi:hypothetical protein